MPDELKAEVVQEQPQQTPDVQTVTPQVTPPVVQPVESVIEASEPEPVRLTDEDIAQGIANEKSNVQKRFDKLTAEKYSLKEEVDKLRHELESIKNAPKEQPEEKKYTAQQLDEAIKYGIENGDSKLVAEAIDHKMKLAIDGAVKQYTEPQEKEKSQQAVQNELWSKFISTLNTSDPDYDFNNTSSAAYKYTQFYLTSPDYKKHYSSFGVYGPIQAANDAMRVISEQKRQKLTNTKLRATEKDLAKEKMKSQFTYGNAYVAPDVDEDKQPEVIIKDPNVDSGLAEFLKHRVGSTDTKNLALR
jgi:hypothetical protein